MKTQPMAHQVEGLARLSANPAYYALGAEQGTGKTWMLMADAEARFERGEIQGLLVIAPNGVHTNWVRREIPRHMSVPNRAAFWLSGAGAKHSKTIARVMGTPPGELAILAVNIDALVTVKGYAVCAEFLHKFPSMLVIDESQRIKTPSSGRTKAAMKLAPRAVSRRIASGTLIANTPIDLFAQYEFLRPGLLGTTSYRAFVAEYADLLPAEHPLVRNVAARSRGARPQIVKRDARGTPQFRNLERLAGLMAPWTFRVLKKDCLDLPEKIYQTFDFALSPEQAARYAAVEDEMRFLREDGNIDTFTALTVIGKLRQLTSGFLLVDGKPTQLVASKERLAALRDILDDTTGQVIIWASFREEIGQIAAMLKDEGVVEFHGGTGTAERQEAVDRFQAGEVRYFVGNPAAAGTGLTLTAAQTAVYYSNSFSLEQRLQSEDRCHRIGTRGHVTYIDLVARDTIDEKIATALQAKQGLSELVMAEVSVQNA